MELQSVLNGLDVGLMGKTIQVIQENPALAQFQFRATTQWISGAHVQSRIQGFHGVGHDDTSRSTPFLIEGDEPSVLLGTNQGANAVELLLAGLSSCLAVGLAYTAAARGITLEALRLDISGDIDLQGFLGLSESVRAGCQMIDVRCHLKSSASDSDLAEMLEHVQKTSPVLDMVRYPTPVHVKLVRI